MLLITRRFGACLRLKCLFALAVLLAASRSPALSSPDQGAVVPVFDATHFHEPRSLDGTWLVHAGDDPGFARPEFDDTDWIRFDPKESLISIFPQHHPEIFWYRLHVKVDPSQTGLALTEWNLSRAFEVYVNGERLMDSGRFTPFVPYTMAARVMKPVPDRMVRTGVLVIALRVHISANEWGVGQNPGYYAYNLTLGQQSTMYRDNWLSIIGEHCLHWLDNLLLVLVGLVALVLFASQRRQTEYLWIFAIGALTLAQSILPVMTTFENVPFLYEVLGSVTRLVSPYIWVSFYFSFVHERIGWKWKTVLIGAGLVNFAGGIANQLTATSSPLLLIGNLPYIILLSVVVPVVLTNHFRRGNREAGILLVPVILFSLYIYAEVAFGTMFQFAASRQLALQGLKLIDAYPAGPFSISLDDVAGILSTFALAIILLLRSTRMSRRQAQLETELEAAQQVQQVLVPEQIEAVPGFVVDTVYQPAQQVGGDFFQILPTADGGILLVLGDVAGKGLPAAMLVSVIVGAIRGVVEYTSEPAELLANLNERLVGRSSGGFSTALVARIDPGGSITIANAGHLSPYLDGRELVLPGALPLGIMAGATYDVTEAFLAPGSRLTFYSDGVAEAQNAKGALFGFERSRELSTMPARVIVEAALNFGQQDDITVVTIERTAEPTDRAGVWVSSAQAPFPFAEDVK